MKKNTKVNDFWQSRAKNVAREDMVTHYDIWQRYLEIELIKKFLYKGKMVDIGCGNGFTTKLIAPKVREVIGIDLSDEMISRANVKKKKDPTNVTFHKSDVLYFKPVDFGMFDIALVERCLINLADWQEQKKAINNIASVLNKGGRFIFVEGLKNGRDNLNRLRVSAGLKKMPKVWHNVDFDEKKLLQFLSKDFEIEQNLHFGVYDFITRVVHPLVVAPKEPRYDSKFNETAAKLAIKIQEFKDISRVIFLVLRRK